MENPPKDPTQYAAGTPLQSGVTAEQIEQMRQENLDSGEMAGAVAATSHHDDALVQRRAALGSREGFRRALSQVPDAPPLEGDELPED